MNQSDKLYKNAVKNMVIGFAYFKIITDKKGKPVNFICLDVNPGFEEKTSLKAKNVIGKSINQIFPKTSKEKSDWIKLCINVAYKNQKRTVEGYFKSFNRWLRIDLFSPSKGYFVTTLIDITKRKIAEDALTENLEKYRSLIQNVNIGIFRNIPFGKGRFIEANPAVVKMFGYKSIKEFLQHNVTDVYANPNDRAFFVKKLIRNGYVNAEEIYLKKKDGTNFFGAVSARLHRNKSGKIDWVDGVIDNIDEHKRMEISLQESELKHRTLVDMSPYAIAAHSEGKIIFVNSTAMRLMGAKFEKQLVGKPIIEVVHPDYRELVKNRVMKMLKSGKPEPLTEEKFIHLDGTAFDVEVNAKPFIYHDKPAIMITAIDITERKKAQEEKKKTVEQTIFFQKRAPEIREN